MNDRVEEIMREIMDPLAPQRILPAGASIELVQHLIEGAEEREREERALDRMRSREREIASMRTHDQEGF